MIIRQDHVDAQFAGQKVRFELLQDPKTLRRLSALNVQPFALFRRFAEGLWRAEDIILVLSLSYSPGSWFSVPVIAQRVRSAAYGHYAPIALAVLEAHLYGIDPDRAVFEDSQP